MTYLLARYRKAIFGALGAGVGSLAFALFIVSPGSVTSGEWYGIVLAMIGGAGGPAVSKPNAPKRLRP
jgi:hypothetical protein